MRFSDVQHQERAISILRRALRSGRMHHAYLLEGPDGVGKELTGRALAARLLCTAESIAPDADACGVCPTCRLLAAGNHPDLHVIERRLHKLHPDRTIRASKGLFLVVDLIRHFLIEPAAMKPTQGARRVFLIREAERMNEEAQNALLKTLEEPPGSASLILVTSSSSRLLPTIRSRCQCVPFDLLPPEFVADELRKRLDLSAADAKALAVLAGGRLGVALRWQRLGLLSKLNEVAGAIEALRARDVEAFGKTIVEIAGELAVKSMQLGDDDASDDEGGSAKSSSKTIPTDELRDALKLVFLLVAAVYRDALVVQSAATDLCALPQQKALVTRLANGTPFDEIEARIRAVSDAERMLDRNVAPPLVCEHLAVALLGELSAVTLLPA